jgi:N utilization substance protein B
MSRRRQGRELVLGCLYAHFSTGEAPDAIFRVQAARVTYDADTLTYAKRLFIKTIAEAETIDGAIRDRATNWDFSRIGYVEKNILRAAVAELWFFPETPAKVVIDEAVEMAKEFGSAQSGSFINGVLDAVYKQMEPDKTGPAPRSGSGQAGPQGPFSS